MDMFAAGDMPEEAGPTAVAPASLQEAAFAALTAAGVRWLVLRGDATALERGGDIDLLVEPGGMGRVDTALFPLGFTAVPSAGHGSHHFLLGYEEAARTWI